MMGLLVQVQHIGQPLSQGLSSSRPLEQERENGKKRDPGNKVAHRPEKYSIVVVDSSKHYISWELHFTMKMTSIQVVETSGSTTTTTILLTTNILLSPG